MPRWWTLLALLLCLYNIYQVPTLVGGMNIPPALSVLKQYY